MLDQHQILLSGDGSHTIVSSSFDTSYHSKHGAITESSIVFIEAGLDHLAENGYKSIMVFEMGFGTGLNALLSNIWAEKHQIQIEYHTIEAYPLSEDLISKLNYGSICQSEEFYCKLHSIPWEELSTLSKSFSFKKYAKKIEDLQLSESFDVIFYDAFAPANQPELWDHTMMEKMYGLLNDYGLLVSFCAQGAFKRNLKSAGFKVEGIPGPPGKREMTRAIKVV